MKTRYIHSDNALDDLREEILCALQHSRPDLLDQVSSLLGLGEMPLRIGQYPFEPHDNHVVYNIGLCLLRTPAHIFQLELRHGVTDLCLCLPFCFHILPLYPYSDHLLYNIFKIKKPTAISPTDYHWLTLLPRI